MQIERLTKDPNFQAQYLSLLMEQRKQFSISERDQAWQGATQVMRQALSDASTRNIQVDIQTLKFAVLQSADVGLLLNKEAKECYIGMVHLGDIVEFKLGYCYRGLRRLLMSSPDVKRISASVVFDGDQFEWEGEWARPKISSNAQSTVIIAAYAWLEQKNGDITSVLLREQELIELEQLDIDRAIQFYGDENASMYRSPWRKRMFEIEALKALFRQCADVLKLSGADDAGVFGSAQSVGQQD